MPNATTARDEMFDLLNVKWLADTPAITGGSAPPIEWQDIALEDVPPARGLWAKASLVHLDSKQSSFGGPAGPRRFTRPGVVIVEIFAPLTLGNGVTLVEQLAIVAREAFEGVSTPSGVWFRGTRIRELANDRVWCKRLVTIEFSYDEFV